MVKHSELASMERREADLSAMLARLGIDRYSDMAFSTAKTLCALLDRIEALEAKTK